MRLKVRGFTRHSRESGNPGPQGFREVALGPRFRGGDGEDVISTESVT
jgi:hypothetical protein